MQTVQEDLDKLVLTAKQLSPSQLGALLRLQASGREIQESIAVLAREQAKLAEMKRG